MINLPTLKNEAERIAALYVLEILDTREEPEFDNIVKLAAIIANTPIATISFVDEDRIWFKASLGVKFTETPRDNSLQQDYPFMVTVPIAVYNNLVIGHLSVAGYEAFKLTESQNEGLALLVQQIITVLQLRLPVINSSIKEFYESILNNIPSDIVVFDAEHKYLFANPGAIKNDELRKYIIGKDDFEYAAYRNRDIKIAQERRDQFLQVKNTGKAIVWEESLLNPEGDKITFLRRMFPMHDEHGNFVMAIGFGMDITERKLLEEKQTVIMDQLSIQNTQLLDFCNIVSHNLRGPLINMSMLVEFIQETKEAEEQKLLVSKLEPVIENLKNTFNELVESIQIRQNGDIKADIIILNVCLQEVLDGLHMEIKRARAKIRINFDDAPSVVYPHKYLASIFYNLISNAIKYQSPDRQLSLELASRRQDGSIFLTVKDNGLGIDLLKHKDSIFKIGKIFHRHPDAKGLGLFMTKTQVEAMGGKIWVESAPDEGAKFSIEFVNQNIN
ncbi:sensor histidine kinase [Pedobacter sp. MR2016-24]|uniref:sensor histidine kinase n=1 Tax=Pedobacter sp. MR2016-24 TaxID=2994466 RepID=UPI002247991F|nr:PAS domain-containing sensor histidine kinase [Pedobacter sp. MR2016-24]MCX2485298.1 PAS domain-containing sensor histidine kinase [Pedobacter sp. MR2016-24]